MLSRLQIFKNQMTLLILSKTNRATLRHLVSYLKVLNYFQIIKYDSTLFEMY